MLPPGGAVARCWPVACNAGYNAPSPAPQYPPAPEALLNPEHARFRRTLVRVLSIQVVTLLLLWLLQARYTR